MDGCTINNYFELFFFLTILTSEALKDLSTSPDIGTFRSKVILWRTSDSEYTSDMALCAEPTNGIL